MSLHGKANKNLAHLANQSEKTSRDSNTYIGSMRQEIREHSQKLKRSREQRKMKREQRKNEKGARMEKCKGAGSKG